MLVAKRREIVRTIAPEIKFNDERRGNQIDEWYTISELDAHYIMIQKNLNQTDIPSVLKYRVN